MPTQLTGQLLVSELINLTPTCRFWTPVWAGFTRMYVILYDMCHLLGRLVLAVLGRYTTSLQQCWITFSDRPVFKFTSVAGVANGVFFLRIIHVRYLKVFVH